MKKLETPHYFESLIDAGVFVHRYMDTGQSNCLTSRHIAKDVHIQVWQSRLSGHTRIIVIRKTSKGWRVKE